MDAQDEALLFHLNEALASTRTQEEFFRVLVAKLRRIVAFERLSIISGEQPGNFTWALISNDASFRTVPDLPLSHDQQPIPETLWQEYLCLQAPRTIRLSELLQRLPNSPLLTSHLQAGLEFVTQVPLWMRRAHTGILNIMTRQDPEFGSADVALLKQVGHLVAISLNNARAFELFTQQDREKTAQLRVNDALLSSKNRLELFTALATEINYFVPCERLLLWLQYPDGRTHGFAELLKQENGLFEQIAEEYWDQHPLSPAQEELAFARFGSAAAMYQGRSQETLSQLQQYSQRPDPDTVFTVLGAPLHLPDQSTGVLMLASRSPHLFAAADLTLVQGLMPQITLAMENLFAFEQIEALRAQLEQEKAYLMDEIKSTGHFEDFVGESAPMQQIHQHIRQVAPTTSTVLISGETGTGKERVARAIHNLSPRKERTLIKLNCAALPAQLIESELFGHEKGAFTGAHDRRIGKFELADRSTLFLDEIGELPLDLQAKLLRVLQEKEFERLGGRRVIHIDVRVIAATNRVLEEEVAAGRFRADLYYRLNVFPIRVPALRERPEDVAPLLRHYVESFTKRMGKPIRSVRERDLRTLQQHQWPGNVRELEHIVEQAVITSQGLFLTFPSTESSVLSPSTLASAAPPVRPLLEVEREAILAALHHTGGRVSGPQGAAKLLGVKPTTLEARMKKLGLQRVVIGASPE